MFLPQRLDPRYKGHFHVGLDSLLWAMNGNRCTSACAMRSKNKDKNTLFLLFGNSIVNTYLTFGLTRISISRNYMEQYYFSQKTDSTLFLLPYVYFPSINLQFLNIQKSSRAFFGLSLR